MKGINIQQEESSNMQQISKTAQPRDDSLPNERNIIQQFLRLPFQCPVIMKTHFGNVKLKTTEYHCFEFDPKDIFKAVTFYLKCR